MAETTPALQVEGLVPPSAGSIRFFGEFRSARARGLILQIGE